MPDKDALPPAPLLQFSRQLEEWRNAHPPRSRLPEEIWTAAVELARQHGLFRTAHTLRLDYMKLKKRVQTVPGVRAAAPAAFVELVAPATVTGECTVEVESARGKLRVVLQGMSSPDVLSLIRSWMAET
jgi:hypothetical protein